MTLSDLCPSVRVCLHLVRGTRRFARPERETRLWASPLPNSSSLLRRPQPKPLVPAGCTRFNARPSCRSPSAGGRRLAPEFGHTTMHADVPSADRATERALLLSRLPACLGPPVVVNGRYANVHYGLRFLLSSFSSFVVSLIKAQATCPFVVLLDNLYSV